jgi:polar amino acid transport system substrate-binding protein
MRHKAVKHACCAVIWLLASILSLTSCGGATETPAAETAAPFPTPTSPVGVTYSPQQTLIPSPSEYSALAAIRARGVLRAGILYNYPPLGFMADNGQVEGYEAALLQHVAESWGVGVEFVQVTRQTRFSMLDYEEVDLLAGAVPHRRELEPFFEFTQTIFRSGYLALVTEDSGIERFADLSTIVVLDQDAADAVSARAVQVGTSPSVTVMNAMDAALMALTETHSTQAIVARREALMLAAQSVPGTRILNEFVQLEPYAFAVRRGDTPLRDLLNITLQGMADSGEMGELFSNNLYGYPSDFFAIWKGPPSYGFADIPVTLSSPESVIERIRRGESLRVVGMAPGGDEQPFDGQRLVDDFNRAVINEIARRWNVSIAESPGTTGEQGLTMLLNGQADLMMGVRLDRGLIGQVGLSQGYYERALRLIHLEDVTIGGIGGLDFTPVVIVEPLDLSQDLVEDNNGYPQITPMGREEAFDALEGRGTYAIVGDEFILALMAQADAQIVPSGDRYRASDYGIATPLSDTDFLALVDFTLQDMQTDGTLANLFEQYLGPYAFADDPLAPPPLEIWPGDGSLLYP